MSRLNLSKKLDRKALTVLWTVREAKNEQGVKIEGMLQVRGRVYYKDDPVLKFAAKPRALVEVMLPTDVAGDTSLEAVLVMAEERLQLDIDEINGKFGSNDPSIWELRRSFDMLAHA
jgi:hypothetical protein